MQVVSLSRCKLSVRNMFWLSDFNPANPALFYASDERQIDLADDVLLVGCTRFPVHKAVLSTKSSVFLEAYLTQQEGVQTVRTVRWIQQGPPASVAPSIINSARDTASRVGCRPHLLGPAAGRSLTHGTYLQPNAVCAE
jgi:hypothetical protein